MSVESPVCLSRHSSHSSVSRVGRVTSRPLAPVGSPLWLSCQWYPFICIESAVALLCGATSPLALSLSPFPAPSCYPPPLLSPVLRRDGRSASSRITCLPLVPGESPACISCQSSHLSASFCLSPQSSHLSVSRVSRVTSLPLVLVESPPCRVSTSFSLPPSDAVCHCLSRCAGV